jgi:hypothetical protein
MDISIGSSSNSETINTLDETESGSDFDSGFIFNSSIAATKGSSVENKDKLDEDIETEVDNFIFQNKIDINNFSLDMI